MGSTLHLTDPLDSLQVFREVQSLLLLNLWLSNPYRRRKKRRLGNLDRNTLPYRRHRRLHRPHLHLRHPRRRLQRLADNLLIPHPPPQLNLENRARATMAPPIHHLYNQIIHNSPPRPLRLQRHKTLHRATFPILSQHNSTMARRTNPT